MLSTVHADSSYYSFGPCFLECSLLEIISRARLLLECHRSILQEFRYVEFVLSVIVRLLDSGTEAWSVKQGMTELCTARCAPKRWLMSTMSHEIVCDNVIRTILLNKPMMIYITLRRFNEHNEKHNVIKKKKTSKKEWAIKRSCLWFSQSPIALVPEKLYLPLSDLQSIDSIQTQQ